MAETIVFTDGCCSSAAGKRVSKALSMHEVVFQRDEGARMGQPMSRPASSKVSPRRGLATIAYLKAQFDSGVDHLDMFQPFVEQAIRHYSADDIEIHGVQAAVRDSTGLRIPAEIVKTLLRRACRKGLLTRSGGRFLRTAESHEDAELTTRIREFASELAGLAGRLRQFAASNGAELQSDDEALAALTGFLDANHIGVVLGQRIKIGSSDQMAPMGRVIAAFLSKAVQESGPDRSIIEDIVKGLIVQNALLLRDVPMAGRHLDGLTVFVDTGVLLRALGYAGATEKRAANEALALIRVAGARLYAFERTVNEVEGILRVYERNLGSSAGIRRLRGTPLTHHFMTVKATPADIRQEILLVKKNLSMLGIGVRRFPPHINEFTEDEQTLADALTDPNRDEDSFGSRVWHDVQAIAAVMTLRAGAQPRRMANAGYVFASGSTGTVVSATNWYRDSHPQGIEPIVHFRSVTNAAWFLRPAGASDVPMHELVAVCAGFLMPSPEIWARFVKGLESLVESGELSDDESIAVLANGFTHIEPGELESESDVEADTVREIAERVRDEHQAELRSQLGEQQRKTTESNRAAATARREVDSVKAGVEARIERLADWAARIVYAVLCVVLVIGAVLTLPIKWSDSSQLGNLFKILAWVCVAMFFLSTVLGFFNRRFHVLNIYDHLKAYLAARLKGILLAAK